MMPVNIVEHLLTGIDQRVEWAYPLFRNDNTWLPVHFRNPERVE